MSDDIQKRLNLIEMALGIDASDVEACPKTPETECGDCGPEHCPVINNLMQITASQTQELGRRLRRLEYWLEILDQNSYPREMAGLRVQQEELAEDIGDVEDSLGQMRGRAPEKLILFLAQQKAKLEQVEAQIQRLQNGRQ